MSVRCSVCVRVSGVLSQPLHLGLVARAYGAGNRVVRWVLRRRILFYSILLLVHELTFVSISLCILYNLTRVILFFVSTSVVLLTNS